MEHNRCPGVRWRTGVKIPAPFPLIAWVLSALLISSPFPTWLSPQVPSPAGPSIFCRAIDLGLIIFTFINTKISLLKSSVKCCETQPRSNMKDQTEALTFQTHPFLSTSIYLSERGFFLPMTHIVAPSPTPRRHMSSSPFGLAGFLIFLFIWYT